MAAQHLTATKIEKYKPVKNEELLPDGNGLYLRFRRGSTGAVTRVWMVTYKLGSSSVYLTLGHYGASLPDFDIKLYRLDSGARLSLGTARRIATEITDWRRRGLVPKEFIQHETERFEAERRQAAIEEERRRLQVDAERLTVQDLFETWLADGVRRSDGNAELRRSFSRDILPALGRIEVRQVSEHEIRSVLRAMVARDANRMAVIARNNLTQMFAWAGKRQPWRKLLVDGDPMALIDIEKIVSPDYDLLNQRDRILTTSEIRELHERLAQMRTDYANAPDKRVAPQPLELTTEWAIWIMLSTTCRVGEMSMARWEHVDLDAGVWFVPRQNVKARVADLTVSLSDFSRGVFERLYRHTGYSKWCFPARDKDTHLDSKSISKQVGDRQTMFKRDKEGGPRAALSKRRSDNSLVLTAGKNEAWTPHDLRRTGATIMQSLGVSLEIIDRCQNHVPPGSRVRRHYLHHDYAEEKRDAWHRLGLHLDAVLGNRTTDVDRARTLTLDSMA